MSRKGWRRRRERPVEHREDEENDDSARPSTPRRSLPCSAVAPCLPSSCRILQAAAPIQRSRGSPAPPSLPRQGAAAGAGRRRTRIWTVAPRRSGPMPHLPAGGSRGRAAADAYSSPHADELRRAEPRHRLLFPRACRPPRIPPRRSSTPPAGHATLAGMNARQHRILEEDGGGVGAAGPARRSAPSPLEMECGRIERGKKRERLGGEADRRGVKNNLCSGARNR